MSEKKNDGQQSSRTTPPKKAPKTQAPARRNKSDSNTQRTSGTGPRDKRG